MTEKSNSLENGPKNQPKLAEKEPGWFDSFGSFPVWMLKIIQLATPGFLIKKNLPDKKSPKS